MAKLVAKKEHEWVERVRSEGPVPHHQPDNCSYGWTSPPGNVFFVRGPEYLKTKVKIPGGDYLLKPLGFDWIKGPTRISELLNNPKNRVRRALEEECSKGHKPFVWAFNLQVPSKDNYSAVAYFVATEPSQEDSLISRFLKGDEGFMTSRLKMIANIAKGPWIVRKAVGEQAICIIGRSLSSKYCIGQNFIEVDIDIGSSMVATAVVHLAFGYLTTLTVDLAFLIEGQSEAELPEKILGAIRFSELDVASARHIELTSEHNMGSVPSSLPTRFWKSLGQGISIVLPSARESGSNLSASYANRALDDNRSSGDVNRQ
ncbi:UNVERIFIED_CONTAM: protein ENHANCED DISEASE RESISTANCE 2-like [Sesamum calycinum]|uniref:Protein ENHANCED DISEASE RESISTANCE 2-like n=1 Tax=Sesamum calycinum TaxID=2727403 RepID=A0AAW2RAT0_9LAMI